MCLVEFVATFSKARGRIPAASDQLARLSDEQQDLTGLHMIAPDAAVTACKRLKTQSLDHWITSP